MRQKSGGRLFKPADTQIDSTTANQGASLHPSHLRFPPFKSLRIRCRTLRWLISCPRSLYAAKLVLILLTLRSHGSHVFTQIARRGSLVGISDSMLLLVAMVTLLAPRQ